MSVDKDGVLIDDLYVPQGSDWDRTYPINDPLTDTPMNVTGWTLEGQVRQSSTTPVLYEWSTANSNVQTGNGFVKITVPAAVSDAWGWVDQAMKYDLELTDTLGKKMRVSKGTFTVTSQITHD